MSNQTVGSGPTGTGPENSSIPSSPGPVGPEGAKEKINTFSKQLTTLMNLCSSIIRGYLENESYQVTYKEMNLHDETDVSYDKLLKEHNKYVESFKMTKEEDKINKYYLGSFNKILKENENVFLQAIHNDMWIRKVNTKTKLPLQLMFGDVLGKESTICSRLGMIYKMSLVMAVTHEKKMKEYPDLFKADEKVTYANNILFSCFKIFCLTDNALDQEVKKPLNIIVNDLSIKLGVNSKSAFDFATMFDNASPLFSLGVDMINKHAETSAAKEGKSTKKIEPNQLKNIFSKVLSNGNIQKVVSDIRDNASSGGPPDFGKIFGSVIEHLDPGKMMNDLKSATESEIPEMAKENAAKTEGTEKVEETEETVEEIIEETEETEEIVEETEIIED